MPRTPEPQQRSVFDDDAYDEEHDKHDKNNVSQMNRQDSREDQGSKFTSTVIEIGRHSATISTSNSSYNPNDDHRIYDSHEGSTYNDSRHSTSVPYSPDRIGSTDETKHLKDYPLRVFAHDRKKPSESFNPDENAGINKRDNNTIGSRFEDAGERRPHSGRNSPAEDDAQPTGSTHPTRVRKLANDQDSSAEYKNRRTGTNNEMSSRSAMASEQDSASSDHGSSYDRQGSHGSDSGAPRGRPDDKDRGACGWSGSRSSWEMVDKKDCESSGSKAEGNGTSLDKFITVDKKNCNKFYTPADRDFDLRKPSGIHDNRNCVELPFNPATIHEDWRNSHLKTEYELEAKLRSCTEIHKIEDLQRMILSYNKGEKWEFSALGKFLKQGIPYLKKGSQCGITLSRKQIACLLCHAFFCTFPGRNPVESYHKPHNRYGRGRAEGSSVDSKPVLPTINFSGLFKEQSDRDESLQGKLHCLFNYFDRVTSQEYEPEGCVTFERRVCKDTDFPDWSKSEKHFTELHVQKEGFIEDDGRGMLQVDFANKKVGGGVLGRGCVQEEIRFLICPELIISRLFTEELEYNETLLITGCERYSNFKGYARSFRYNGNCFDETESDSYGRKLTQVVAMDAKNYRKPEDQFHPRAIDRELKKAYCGFLSPVKVSNERLPAVATGNWGCGAFNGDRHVKALIQLMAAAEAGRDVLYITIDDDQLVEDLFDVHKIFTDKRLTVGNAFNILKNYATDFHTRNFPSNRPKLFDYIKLYNSDVKV